MRLLPLLSLALALLSGCESVNATLVRQLHQDWGLSRRLGQQIRDGLERRLRAPGEVQKIPAPPFLDQGRKLKTWDADLPEKA